MPTSWLCPSVSCCSTATSFDFSDLRKALPGPPSYYQVQEINRAPPSWLSRVPSQYQLEELKEVYVFDIPHLTAHCGVPLDGRGLEMEELRLVYAPSEYVSF